MHYDLARMVYDGGPGSCGRFTKKLSEGKKRDSATPYIRVCQITHFPWKRIKCIFIGFVFANLSFNVVLILTSGLLFFSEKSLARRSICNNVSPPCERKSLISIFHTTPSTQCEKYYGLMGRKHVEHSIQLHATALLPELLFCTRRSNIIPFFPSSDMIYERILLLRDALLYFLSQSILLKLAAFPQPFFLSFYNTSRASQAGIRVVSNSTP